MKILLHGLAMRKRGGGSRHLEGLIESLGQLDRENEYLVCLNSQFEFASPYPNITVLPVRVKSAWHRLWWDQASLPRLARAWRADVVVALFIFGMYTSAAPQIALQRNSQFYCPFFLDRLRGRAAVSLAARRWMAYLTMRASRLIVTPSQSMCDMIRRFHPDLPQERFRVLPHGFERAQVARQALPPVIAQQLERVGNRPMLLYISHLEPHKAHEVALQAMRELQSQGRSACLCLTMDRRDWSAGYDRLIEQVGVWGLSESVINLGRVPEGALDELYRRAAMFFFPSLCESFGFPMIEAMSYGLPMVAADTPINREVCGRAARYYAPLDGRAAAQQIMAWLDAPEQLALARKVSEQQYLGTHLDWLEYGRRFIEILKESALHAA